MATSEDDESAVRAVVEAWHRATSAGDVARILPLMADDATFLAPGRPPMEGRATFERAFNDLLVTHTIATSALVREVEVSGNLAYSWADLTVTVAARDGSPPKTRTGPTLSVFRRQADGRWVLVCDANMLSADAAELELKVDNLERELMADGPGG